VALLLAVTLAACQAPPVKPSGPTEAERQHATLHALGFVETEAGWLLNLPEPISFELDKDVLKASMQQSIAKTAAELIGTHVNRLRIEGHTDNSGPREYNIALSLRRAHNVAHEFVVNGFAADHITEQGLGPENPLASNDTRQGRQSNRCVLIIVPVEALAQ
jgi:outer membrane protein OmpA-like peptidoglycan-associated protein